MPREGFIERDIDTLKTQEWYADLEDAMDNVLSEHAVVAILRVLGVRRAVIKRLRAIPAPFQDMVARKSLIAPDKVPGKRAKLQRMALAADVASELGIPEELLLRVGATLRDFGNQPTWFRDAPLFIDASTQRPELTSAQIRELQPKGLELWSRMIDALERVTGRPVLEALELIETGEVKRVETRLIGPPIVRDPPVADKTATEDRQIDIPAMVAKINALAASLGEVGSNDMHQAARRRRDNDAWDR